MAPTRASAGNNRGWWRDYFIDHPGLKAKLPDASTGTGSSAKVKVYCSKCFESHVTAVLAEDQLEVNAVPPRRQTVRAVASIETYLWSMEASTDTRGWLRSVKTTLLRHLRYCELNTAETRTRAEDDHIAAGGAASPGKGRRRRQPDPPIETYPYPIQTHSLNLPNPSPVAGPSTGFGTLMSYHNSPGPPFTSLPVLASASPSMSNFPLPVPFADGPPYSPSIPDSALASASASPMLHHAIPLSRASSHSANRRASSRLVPDTHTWSSVRQKQFENAIARLTASAGLPLSWVDNAEWIAFVDGFLPAARSPSRKVLTNRLIPTAVTEFQAAAKVAANGREATIQADGWTGVNHHHLIAFMITVDGKIRTVKVHDASAERKTAEQLMALLEGVIMTVQDEWGAIVVAIVTDASGECRKARRLLGRKYPHIVVLDCYGHQVNLVVGDYFRSPIDVLQYTEIANELITWLRSKTLVLALLRKAQLDTTGTALAVIQAVLTRWTAHYQAYKRLLELQGALQMLVSAEKARPDSKKLIATGERKAKDHANKMMEVITDSMFWRAIARMKRHLEPLAIAANITQASFCRLDTVLLTFGFLLMQYRQMTDDEDLDAAAAIMESIERRWAVADQQIFIAAVIVNPFYQGRPFAQLYFLNNAGIHALLGHLWTRFYQTQAPQEFHTELTEYLTHSGRYVSLGSHCGRASAEAQAKCIHPDPLSIFVDFSFAGQAPTPFIRLTRRILTICANSATCERLWSVFGMTLTKLRNRLGLSTLTSLSELKMHIRDEHMQKETKTRMKRMFVQRAESARAAASSSQHFPIPEAPPIAADSQPSDTSSVDNTTSQHHASQPQSNDRFSDMATRHAQSSQEDETDREPVAIANIIGRSVKLVELFNFSDSHWVQVYENAAQRTFDEELKLYELLDLDAEGEEEANIDVDDSTGELLIG